MVVTGVVLAGGASRRMGTDKALVEVAGRSMAAHAVGALRPVAERVLVAGRDVPLEGAEQAPDPPGAPHRGPLAGLVAGMSRAEPGLLVVVAVDQPWVRAETLRRLVEAAGDIPVVPVEEGVRQTTCAVYPTRIVEVAREELAGGGSIQSLLDRTAFLPVVEETWRGWGEDGRSWYSADTREALEEGLGRYGPPGA